MIKRVGTAIFLIVVIAFMAGCSSGGGGRATTSQISEPQIVVKDMITQWRSSSDGPAFSIDHNGKPAIMNSEATSEQSLGSITFAGLASETWTLQIDKVEYPDDDHALVHASFAYQSATSGGLVTIFYLYKEDYHWYVYDIAVTELPSAISPSSGIIQGYITDDVSSLAISGARIEAYPENSQTLAGSAVTGDNGFYQISDLTPGTYYLVIDRDGYDSYTKSGIVVN